MGGGRHLGGRAAQPDSHTLLHLRVHLPACPPARLLLAPQVDAEKRTLIRQLPHTLVLHLKRFEWDYETYQRWKVGIFACGLVYACLVCCIEARAGWLAEPGRAKAWLA